MVDLETIIEISEKVNKNEFVTDEEEQKLITETLEIESYNTEIVTLKTIAKAIQERVIDHHFNSKELPYEAYNKAYEMNEAGQFLCSLKQTNKELTEKNIKIMESHFLGRQGLAGYLMMRKSRKKDEKTLYLKKDTEDISIVDFGKEIVNKLMKSSKILTKINRNEDRHYAIRNYILIVDIAREVNRNLEICISRERDIIIANARASLKALRKAIKLSELAGNDRMGRITEELSGIYFFIGRENTRKDYNPEKARTYLKQAIEHSCTYLHNHNQTLDKKGYKRVKWINKQAHEILREI